MGYPVDLRSKKFNLYRKASAFAGAFHTIGQTFTH